MASQNLAEIKPIDITVYNIAAAIGIVPIWSRDLDNPLKKATSIIPEAIDKIIQVMTVLLTMTVQLESRSWFLLKIILTFIPFLFLVFLLLLCIMIKILTKKAALKVVLS